MAQIFTISDNDSDPSEDQEKTEQTQDNSGSSQPSQCLTVPERLKVLVAERHRNLSVNETMGEEDPLVDSFRPRSRSAPPLLWAAKKYGQQLRRMSDEFANLLDKGANIRRVESVGTPRQMRQSPSWLALLWSHKESEAESRPAE